MYHAQPVLLNAAGNRHIHQQPLPVDPALPSACAPRHLTLAPASEAAKSARTFTAATLRDWNQEELVQDAVLIACELISNAICHGVPFSVGDGERPPVGLSWSFQAGLLVCTVIDWNTRPPVLTVTGPSTETGRGLQIVASLAVAWGWTILSVRQKAVWAALQPTALAQGRATAY